MTPCPREQWNVVKSLRQETGNKRSTYITPNIKVLLNSQVPNQKLFVPWMMNYKWQNAHKMNTDWPTKCRYTIRRQRICPRLHFTFICSSKKNSLIWSRISIIYRLIIDPRNYQLPVALIAQLVKHCNGITEVRVWVLFRPFFHYSSSSIAKLQRSLTLKLGNVADLLP